MVGRGPGTHYSGPMNSPDFSRPVRAEGHDTPQRTEPPPEPALHGQPIPLVDKVLAAVVFSLGIALLYSTFILIE